MDKKTSQRIIYNTSYQTFIIWEIQMTDNIETSKSSSDTGTKKEVLEVLENTKSETNNLRNKIKDALGKLADWEILGALTTLFTDTRSGLTQQSTENQSDKSTPSQKEKAQDWIDEEKHTYTNSKSWLTFCMYDQNDPRRWSKKKNWGTTMNQTGCLLTSAAVIHSMVDPSITPDFYRQNYAGRFTYDSIPKASEHKIQSNVLLPGEKNKWPEEKTQRAVTEMVKNLEKWYPVNFMVHWPKHGGNNTLTTGQHYMTAVDIREKDGKKEVFIANTHNGKWWGRFSIDKAFASLRQASTYTPAQA